jgi:predicted nucleic acid-binding protein
MKAAAKQFVLDASITVAWCFEDETTPLSERVLDLLSAGSEAFVPALWPLEVANALLVAERRQRTSVAHATTLLQRIATLPISVEAIEPLRAFDQILSLARQARLTEYDAAYAELALRRNLPLASLDDKLVEAARSLGISVVTG